MSARRRGALTSIEAGPAGTACRHKSVIFESAKGHLDAS
jgi:hypothetical protein